MKQKSKEGRTIAGITVGSCACYDDFHSVYRDWISLGDRILNIVGLLPCYADGHAFRVSEWYLKNDTSEDEAVIYARFGWQDENSCILCAVEFPAKYLFMPDEEIIADWNARIKAFEDAKQQEKQDARYREFLNIKERYLALKAEFEPEEPDAQGTWKPVTKYP